MGEVYRAADPQLGRDVAIKVLLRADSWNPDRLRRFEQEARALAALNHPNILAVYQMGSHEGAPYLVSELLQGATLREEITGSRLAPRKAIDYAVQIARGLAAAHEKGIANRDLKPENIFVTSDGAVKVLDFGLAKLTPAKTGTALDASTKTIATDPGTVMGTVGYMSPEQVRGEETGHRGDIFSFGVILFEVLTGRRAFQKPTAPETMASILNEEPPELSRFSPNLAPGLQRIIIRCLEKKPEQRFQSASDLAFALEALSAVGDSSGALPVQPKRSVTLGKKIFAAVVLALLLAGGFWWRTPPSAPQITGTTQITRDGVQKWGLVTDGARLYFSEGDRLNLQLMQVSTVGGEATPIATTIEDPFPLDVAPDSSGLLVSAYKGADAPIWWLPLPSGAARRLGDLKGNSGACFFPDGQKFAYADGHSIKVADRDGSNSQTIVEADGVTFAPIVSPDGRRIRFVVGNKADSFTLWEADVTTRKANQIAENWPERVDLGRWTPDGRHSLFIAAGGGKAKNRIDLWELPEKSDFWDFGQKQPRRLTNGPLAFGVAPVVSQDGSRIFTTGLIPRGEMLRYDAAVRQFVPFLGGLSAYITRFSTDGKWIVYTSYPDEVLWRAREDGTDRVQLSFPPLNAQMFAISPDGSQVAFAARKPGERPDLYVVGIQGGTPRRVAGNSDFPVWSPNGASLSFAQGLASGGVVTTQLDLRDGKVSALPDARGKRPIAWPSSGRLIAKINHIAVAFDEVSRTWSPLAIGPFAAVAPSPDGKYIYWEGLEVPNHKIHRTRLADGQVESLLEIHGLHNIDGYDGGELTVTPDGSVLVTRDLGNEDIYALSVKWR
jgi:Tol biopolymer transport system component